LSSASGEMGISLYNQSLRTTQPGQPIVSRHDEYQWKSRPLLLRRHGEARFQAENVVSHCN